MVCCNKFVIVKLMKKEDLVEILRRELAKKIVLFYVIADILSLCKLFSCMHAYVSTCTNKLYGRVQSWFTENDKLQKRALVMFYVSGGAVTSC